MIELHVQLDAIKYVEKKLKELGTSGNAQAIAKKAVNETARRARKELIGKAKDTYTVKKGRFNEEIKLKGATVGSLQATILGSGKPIPLNRFKVSAGKRATKVQIVKSGSLKELKRNSDGVKSFVNNIARKGMFRSKTTSEGEAGEQVIHYAVAQRENKDKRLGIKELYSNSIPVMVGSRRVYGQKEDEIMEMLKDSLDRHIQLALGD